MHKGFIVEDIKRTKVAMDIFSVRLPVSELWRENHFRVAENAIRKHDTGFMHKSFIVEDFERTKVVMNNFSVPLPVLELWPKNHFRVVEMPLGSVYDRGAVFFYLRTIKTF